MQVKHRFVVVVKVLLYKGKLCVGGGSSLVVLNMRCLLVEQNAKLAVCAFVVQVGSDTFKSNGMQWSQDKCLTVTGKGRFFATLVAPEVSPLQVEFCQ